MNYLFKIEFFASFKMPAATKYSLFPAFFSLASNLLQERTYLQKHPPAIAAHSAAYFQKG